MGAVALSAAAMLAGVISARDSPITQQPPTLDARVESIYDLSFHNYLTQESTTDWTNLFYQFTSDRVPESLTLYEDGVPIKTYIPEVADNLQAGRQINFLTVPDITDSGHRYFNWGRLEISGGEAGPETKQYFIEIDMGSHVIRTPAERIDFLGVSSISYKDNNRFEGQK